MMYIHKHKNAFMVFIVLLLLTAIQTGWCQQAASDGKWMLWYPKPAEKWVEALPIGNGIMRAMVFGKTDVERIQFNEDSLWTTALRLSESGAAEVLPQLRQLLFDGKKARPETGDGTLHEQSFATGLLPALWRLEADLRRASESHRLSSQSRSAGCNLSRSV
jgi:hypothetical protein